MTLKYENTFSVGDYVRVYDFPDVPDFYIEGTIVGIKEKTFVIHCTKDTKPNSFLVDTKFNVPMESDDDLMFDYQRIKLIEVDESFDPSNEIMAYLEKEGLSKREDIDSFLQVLTLLFIDSKKKYMKIGIKELAANTFSMKDLISYIESEC